MDKGSELVSCTRAERALLDMIACWPGVPARVIIHEDGGYSVATPERHIKYGPDPMRALAAFAPSEHDQAISHNRAEIAACRLIHSHFGRDDQVQISKPPRDDDDDLVLLSYIQQQRGQFAPDNDALFFDLLQIRDQRTVEQDRAADEEELASDKASTNIRLIDAGFPPLGEGEAPLDSIYDALDEAGMLHRSGGVFLSPETALRPGPLLFMGLNPGGDERDATTTVLDNLVSCRMGHCAWEELWKGEAGDATLQRRFKQVARFLGIDPLALPATNVVFTRSRNVASHRKWAQDRKAAKAVHSIIADTVKPKKLWFMGNTDQAGNLLTELKVEWRQSKDKGWSYGHGTAVYAGHTVVLCHTPHLSRWNPAGKEDELRFAFGLTGDCKGTYEEM